jgi:hypothetical protein
MAKQPANGSPNGNTSESPNQSEMCRKSFEHNGINADLGKHADWIKTEFGVDLPRTLISTIRSAERARKKKKRRAEKKAHKTEMVPAKRSSSNPDSIEMLVDAMTELKKIQSRIGAAQLQKLVDIISIDAN